MNAPPKAIASGEIELGPATYACHVLSNGMRVLCARGKPGADGMDLVGLLALYAAPHGLPTVRFALPNGSTGEGFDAAAIVDVAVSYLDAYENAGRPSAQQVTATMVSRFLGALVKAGRQAIAKERAGRAN